MLQFLFKAYIAAEYFRSFISMNSKIICKFIKILAYLLIQMLHWDPTFFRPYSATTHIQQHLTTTILADFLEVWDVPGTYLLPTYM